MNQTSGQANPSTSQFGIRRVLLRSGAASGLAITLAGMDAAAALIVSRSLGPSDRGIFVLAITIGGFAALFSQAGISTAGRLALVDAAAPLPLQVYLGSSLVHVLGGGVVGGIAAYGSFFWLFAHPSWLLVFATALITMTMTAFYLLADALNAYGRTSAAMASSAIGSGAFVGLSAIGMTFNWAPATYILINGTTMAVQIALALLLLRGSGPIGIVISISDHARLLRVGVAAVPYVLGTALVFRLDRYVIGLLSDESAVGIYSIAASLSEMGRFLPNAVGQLLFFGAASGLIAERVQQRARTLSLMASVPVLVALAVLAEPLIEITLGREYAGSVAPLRILLLGEIFAASMLIDVRLLAGSGRIWLASLVTMLATVVSVGLDIALVPTHGIQGAALATVVAYVIGGSVARRLVRHQPVPTRTASQCES